MTRQTKTDSKPTPLTRDELRLARLVNHLATMAEGRYGDRIANTRTWGEENQFGDDRPEVYRLLDRLPAAYVAHAVLEALTETPEPKAPKATKKAAKKSPAKRKAGKAKRKPAARKPSEKAAKKSPAKGRRTKGDTGSLARDLMAQPPLGPPPPRPKDARPWPPREPSPPLTADELADALTDGAIYHVNRIADDTGTKASDVEQVIDELVGLGNHVRVDAHSVQLKSAVKKSGRRVIVDELATLLADGKARALTSLGTSLGSSSRSAKVAAGKLLERPEYCEPSAGTIQLTTAATSAGGPGGAPSKVTAASSSQPHWTTTDLENALRVAVHQSDGLTTDQVVAHIHDRMGRPDIARRRIRARLKGCVDVSDKSGLWRAA